MSRSTQPIRFARSLLLMAALLAFAPGRSAAQWPPESFTNLKVLPSDIETRTLVGMMADFTRALGVRCTFCHVGREGIPLSEYDFAADEKPTKLKARRMLEMVGQINNVYLAGLENRAEPAVGVQCMTCHRGVRQPRMLQDILIRAWDDGGVDSTVARYTRLRERYYGSAAYDFGEVALIDVANHAVASGDIAAAIRFHELNVELNPGSAFARGNLIVLSLRQAAATGGIDAVDATLEALRERFSASDFPEPLLNTVGYELLRAGSVDVAVAVFERNVELFPESSNTHDSLGEALAAAGDVAAAIRSYERALELDPDNANAAARLRELRGR